MLTQTDNELITRTGPGTPMGEYLRRFWLPALLSNEISDPDCPPVRVKILNEELVAFRDTNGEVGILDNNCPHRRASLFFGRSAHLLHHLTHRDRRAINDLVASILFNRRSGDGRHPVAHRIHQGDHV